MFCTIVLLLPEASVIGNLYKLARNASVLIWELKIISFLRGNGVKMVLVYYARSLLIKDAFIFALLHINWSSRGSDEA